MTRRPRRLSRPASGRGCWRRPVPIALRGVLCGVERLAGGRAGDRARRRAGGRVRPGNLGGSLAGGSVVFAGSPALPTEDSRLPRIRGAARCRAALLANRRALAPDPRRPASQSPWPRGLRARPDLAAGAYRRPAPRWRAFAPGRRIRGKDTAPGVLWRLARIDGTMVAVAQQPSARCPRRPASTRSR